MACQENIFDIGRGGKMKRHNLWLVVGMVLVTMWLTAIFTTLTVYSATGQVSTNLTENAQSKEISISISKFPFDEVFSSDELFNSGNLKPGDTISQSIEVVNVGVHNFTYTASARKTGGSDMLYQAFHLQVYAEDKQLLYKGLLADFNGFEPRTLSSGVSETLYFEVELPYDFGSKDRGLHTRTGHTLKDRLLFPKEYQDLNTQFEIVFEATGKSETGGGNNGGSSVPNDGSGSDDETGSDDESGADNESGSDDESNSDNESGSDEESGSNNDPGSNDETDSIDESGSNSESGSNGASGERLPNTATNLFGLLLIGLAMLVTGGIWYWFHRGEKRGAKEVRNWFITK
jgi:LPXTG-motif cell wall-anchored protein